MSDIGALLNDALLSRPANPDRQTAEVRVTLGLPYVAVLDTLAGQLGSSRTALVEAAVREYIDKQVYQSRALVRMFDTADRAGNPTQGD